MEVHILLEHQLNEQKVIESTTIVDVFLSKEDAEANKEYAERVDRDYVKHMMCDPCKYQIKTFKVIE